MHGLAGFALLLLRCPIASEASWFAEKAEEAFNLALDYFRSADDVYHQVPTAQPLDALLFSFSFCISMQRQTVCVAWYVQPLLHYATIAAWYSQPLYDYFV